MQVAEHQPEDEGTLTEHQGDGVLDRNKGLLSTFQVVQPEFTVNLTIRHRSVTVEVSEQMHPLFGVARLFTIYCSMQS